VLAEANSLSPFASERRSRLQARGRGGNRENEGGGWETIVGAVSVSRRRGRRGRRQGETLAAPPVAGGGGWLGRGSEDGATVREKKIGPI
jgi:hypothetical protein